MPRYTKTERAEAIAKLRDMLRPGDMIYTTTRKVSRSGMSRDIDLYVIQDNAPRWLSWLTARAVGLPFDRKTEAVKVGGCGMDMGFHLVYTLGAVLWPDGTPEPHGTRNGEPDRAGGYALKHSWL